MISSSGLGGAGSPDLEDQQSADPFALGRSRTTVDDCRDSDGAIVILHPDPIVPLGFVIEAYDAAKASGFEQVSFAVNPRRR